MTGRTMLTVHYQYSGEKEVPALPTPAPGLWAATEDGLYHLVHQSSGICAAADFPSPEAALAAAVELATLLDWSLPALAVQEALDADPGLVRAREEIAVRYGGNTAGNSVTLAECSAWDAR